MTLGIPTVRDRVVQMAALLILEPIFEQILRIVPMGFVRAPAVMYSRRQPCGSATPSQPGLPGSCADLFPAR